MALPLGWEGRNYIHTIWPITCLQTLLNLSNVKTTVNLLSSYESGTVNFLITAYNTTKDDHGIILQEFYLFKNVMWPMFHSLLHVCGLTFHFQIISQSRSGGGYHVRTNAWLKIATTTVLAFHLPAFCFLFHCTIKYLCSRTLV